MHISEVLSEESTGQRCSNERLVSKIKKRVQQVEQILPMISPKNTTKLRDYMMRLVPCQQVDEEHAKLRQVASELLLTAGQVEGIQSGMLKTATFFHRTGAKTAWEMCQRTLTCTLLGRAKGLLFERYRDLRRISIGEAGRWMQPG
eukprot:Gb_10796 [translate_table: standard]